MKSMDVNISALKEMLEKRETYIRFSPAGTVIMGIMYVMFYLFAGDFNSYYYTVLFFSIAVIGVIIVTLLSLLNSKEKGEKLLPKSIRYIIVNMFFIGVAIAPLLWWFSVWREPMSVLFPIICMAYGLLIIVSRFCIQKFLVYFGYVLFIIGLILIVSLVLWAPDNIFYEIVAIYKNIYKELILTIFGFGHIFMGYLLYKKNK